MTSVVIRFDVSKHEIYVETFVASAQATQLAVSALSQELFNDPNILQVYVVAPESACLRQIMRIGFNSGKYLLGGVAIVWAAIQALETDIAKEITKELTGNYPADIAVERVRRWKDAVAETELNEVQNQELEELCEELESRIAKLASESLAAPREKIERLSVSEIARHDLAEAQAKLFKSCIENEKVGSLHIETSKEPPIPRNQFPARALQPKRNDEDDDNPEWDIVTEEIEVTSPNLDESDQKTRKWKGRLRTGKTINFSILDQNFWAQVEGKKYRFGKGDKISAQLAVLRNGKKNRRDIKAVKILSFNDETLGESLDANALSTILGRISSQEKAPNLLDFLDDG